MTDVDDSTWQVLDAEPLDVLEPLAAERATLLALLADLEPAAWTAPTDCPGWRVREVAAHLLHDDLRLIAHLRDGWSGVWYDGPTDDLAPWLAARNGAFVDGTADLSPLLLVDLLGFTGAQLAAVYAARDPRALDDGVAWAVPDGPAPCWLGTGREYTERLAHQNQIRRAAGRPPLDGERWLGPALDVWRWCLPVALAGTRGTIEVAVRDPDRVWVLRDGRFVGDASRERDAQVVVPASQLAAVWTAAPGATLGPQVAGDTALVDAVARSRAIIV